MRNGHSSETQFTPLPWKPLALFQTPPGHRSPEAGRPSQSHHRHAQGPAEMGKSRLPHARRPHSKEALLRGTLIHEPTVDGQRKHYKESLKVSLKDCWRQLITKGAHAAEELRSRKAEEKRAVRKERAASTNCTAPTHFCPTCERGFLARIGLISNLRTLVAIHYQTRSLWSSSITKDEQQQQLKKCT